MITILILWTIFCMFANIIFWGAVSMAIYKENNKPKVKTVKIKYVSNVLEDGGKFYVKVIYNDRYTDTYVFKTKKIAEAFRTSMLNIVSYGNNQKGR